jgi:predicted transcriptional regulator
MNQPTTNDGSRAMTIRLSEGTYQRLRLAAFNAERTKSDVMRDALDRHLDLLAPEAAAPGGFGSEDTEREGAPATAPSRLSSRRTA